MLLVASFKFWISWWFNILKMTALFPFYEVKLPVLMFMWQNRVHLGKVVKRWSGTILHCATISPSPNSWYLTIPSVDTFLGRPSEDVICFAADAGVHFAWSAERGRRGEQNSANCVLKTHFSHSRKYVFPGKLQQHRFWINMPLPYIKDYKLAMLLKKTQ